MRSLSLAAIAAAAIGFSAPASATTVSVQYNGFADGLSAHVEYDRPFNDGLRAGADLALEIQHVEALCAGTPLHVAVVTANTLVAAGARAWTCENRVCLFPTHNGKPD